MSAKAPIYLKRGSRQGKKEKLRALLSRDMISPPLGDFRHTIHVGGAGDTFGDLSFLRGQLHLLPPSGRPPALPPLPVPAGLPAPPKPPRLRPGQKAPAGAGGGGDVAAVAAAPEPSRAAAGAAGDGAAAPALPPAGSLLSLHVDLGPSILEDVLRVMDKQRGIPT